LEYDGAEIVPWAIRKVNIKSNDVFNIFSEASEEGGEIQMDFFTVRAKFIGGEMQANKWMFRSREQAAAKFKELCGPLCEEAWLIHWAEGPSARGKKEVVMEQHWTLRRGMEKKQELLGNVKVMDNDESLLEFDDEALNQIENTGLAEVANKTAVAEFTQQLDGLFPTPSGAPATDSSIHAHPSETCPATVDESEALRILIVDDEPAILEYLTHLLGAWGHETVPKILTTENDAKKIIETVRITAFDVVISDVIMPGMDGFHLLEMLAPISPASAFIISDAGGCIECAKELKKKGIWVEPLLKPFERQELYTLLNGVGSKYGRDFRRLQRGRIRVEAQVSLADGDRLAQLLEPIVLEFIRGFDLSTAPSELQACLMRTAQRLVYYGLRLHCLLYESPYRRMNQPVDLGVLFEKWLAKSLTAHTRLRGYDANCRGIPGFVFDKIFDSEVEPIHKQLGLGWWKRMKNRSKFRNLFDAGILLVMIYDILAKELADSYE
jgi:CheY-like chemotaxis protein